MIPINALLEIIEFLVQLGNSLGMIPVRFISIQINRKSLKVLKRCLDGNRIAKARGWAVVPSVFVFLSIAELGQLLRTSSQFSKLEYLAHTVFHIFDLSISSVLVMVILIFVQFSEELCQAVNNMLNLGHAEMKGTIYAI